MTISAGGRAYGYTVDNQLALGGPGGVALAYDPLGRLYNGNIDSAASTTLLYDGTDVTAETDQSTGALLRRYVYGSGDGREPRAWLELAGPFSSIRPGGGGDALPWR